MAIIAVMARLEMAINMVFIGVFSKNSKNSDQQPKRFKNMNVVKSCDRNKFIAEKMAISLVFSTHLSLHLRDP
jgi:hypothetical protein